MKNLKFFLPKHIKTFILQSYMESKKALVLYSGGLDSRLAVKLLLDQGFDVTALYFNLPFGCGCCNFSCNWSFTQKEKVKMEVVDVTKEPYLSEYLELIANPKFGRGSSINPCKDCKLYIYLKAKEYADEHGIRVIASGEVVGQRPMSQIRSAMSIIDENIDYELLRPLSAKILEETSYERDGLVDRSKLLDIKGRGRKKQMALAEKYKISYPNPGGGCFLCEKPSERLIPLMEHGLVNEKTLPLTMSGRHFMINDVWFVVARNVKESELLDNFETILDGGKGMPTVYLSDIVGKKDAERLQKAFSTGATEEERESFDEYKL